MPPFEDDSSLEEDFEESMIRDDFTGAVLCLDKPDFSATATALLESSLLSTHLNALILGGTISTSCHWTLKTIKRIISKASALRRLAVDDTEAILEAYPNALSAVRACPELMHVHLCGVRSMGCTFVACLTALQVAHLEIEEHFEQPELLFDRSRPTLEDLTIIRTDEITVENAKEMLGFIVDSVRYLITLKYLTVEFRKCHPGKPPIHSQAVLDAILTMHPKTFEKVEIIVGNKASKWVRPC